MKSWVDRIVPKGSLIREFLSFARSSPFHFFQCVCRSILASHALSGRFLPVVCVVYPYGRLLVSRSPTARVKISGVLRCIPYLGGTGNSSIIIGANSAFTLSGDFYIGQDVVLKVADGGELIIGGRRTSTGSGITAETKVLSEKYLKIGYDSIISWGCVITDSNWHDISNVERSASVIIGDNVWISHYVSVLKGSIIPEGCIIAAHAVVTKPGVSSHALLAGNPAAVKRKDVSWRR
jgi:acetyltransferase-like isoleucine patch superfamily enzyme